MRQSKATGDELVQVGTVGRPHGLDGAFVVERPSDDPSRFEVGAVLYLDGEPVTVVLARRVGGGRLAVKLDRVVDRGRALCIRRSQLPPLDDDRFYVFELLGLEAVGEDGHVYGRVRDVLPGTANDNLELEDGTLVPLIEDAIRAVERDAGRIVVASGFLT